MTGSAQSVEWIGPNLREPISWLALVNAEEVIEIVLNLANATRSICAAAGVQVGLELTQLPTTVK
jgi:hypothetical protein